MTAYVTFFMENMIEVFVSKTKNCQINATHEVIGSRVDTNLEILENLEKGI